MWYYTLDNQQKGPVSQDELQQMLKDELSTDTLVWKDGMANWTKASELFELHASDTYHSNEPASTTVDPELTRNPYASPSTVAYEAVVTNEANEIPEEPIPLDISFCIKQGWKFTCRNFGKIFLFGLVYMVLCSAIDGTFSSIGRAIDGPPPVISDPVEEVNYDEMEPSEAFMHGFNTEFQKEGGPVEGLMIIPSQLIQSFFSLGVVAFALSLIRGQDASIGQLFSQSPWKLVKYLVASLFYGVMVGVGFLFLIFPGIYLAIRFGYYQFAIVDKDLGIIESLKYSSQLTRDNKMNLLLLGLLSFLIVVAGFIALGVGLLWACPTVWLASTIAYCYMHGGERSIDAQS